MMEAIRAFFNGRGYLEVETPCRIPAPIPEATIIPFSSGAWFLQTSPEVCMKRLLARGASKIFQICKAFRRDERGRKHLPEFTMLEWYRTGADYNDLMAETEAMVRFVAAALGFDGVLRYQGSVIDLAAGWQRISVSEALARYAGICLKEGLSQDRFDEVVVDAVEPALSELGPAFLYDYPAATGASLARLKPSDPRFAERFELYIAGLELCNGFSELTGEKNYRERFEHARNQQHKNFAAAFPAPLSFLADIGDMPSAAGNALGIDRLAMIFCDTDDIAAVVAFPPEDL
jgi:elongation factor P--(R)-beta-lysine ligase